MGAIKPAEADATDTKRPDQGRRRKPVLRIECSSLTLASLPFMRMEVPCRPRSALSTDHYFICWPAWGIYHALTQHGLMQGTNCPDAEGDAVSPRKYLSLPEFLRPTPLQLAKVHKRWIDRFPFPRMRDNMILLDGLVDLEDFIRDLFGKDSLCLRPDAQGPTWEPKSWFLGTEFSLKWGYLFL